MIRPDDIDERRLEELLAGHVLGDLSEDESLQLASLPPDDIREEIEELEFVAAAAELAISKNGVPESLPADLRNRILRQADNHLPKPGEQVGSGDASKSSAIDTQKSISPAGTGWKAFRIREAIAWLACAASIALAFGLWSTRNPGEIALSAAEARSALITQSTDLVQVEWDPGKTPFESPVEGDVVWSTEKQRGFMRFVGMPPNNPDSQQYQLWIIDPKRDEEPVDGGVFNISDRGEVVVPINAKLDVINPAAFAVTIEQPGGVVVSTQERLPLIAMVE